MIYRTAILLASLFLYACTDGSDGVLAPPPAPLPDFTAADAWIADFVEQEPLFPGGSIVIVDKARGVIHKNVFGNQMDDSLVLLASTTKVPTVMLLMALHEDDDNVDFDIQAPIANYLPWQGVWDEAITTENLVSNRSGIPGLTNLFTRPADYAPHICQYQPTGTLLECAETLFTSPLPNIPGTAADTAFDYGGTQWQLAGAVAETVGGATWNQLWDQYIGGPCDLQVSRYGNNLGSASEWTGDADALIGLDNPNMEGGLMSSLDDYARLLSLHLNDGFCGDNQVLSAEGVGFMRVARTEPVGESSGYGMGWWITPAREGGSIYLYTDPGFYGSISWIDIERNYAGAVFFEEYLGVAGRIGSSGVASELIPLIEQAIDAVR